MAVDVDFLRKQIISQLQNLNLSKEQKEILVRQINAMSDEELLEFVFKTQRQNQAQQAQQVQREQEQQKPQKQNIQITQTTPQAIPQTTLQTPLQTQQIQQIVPITQIQEAREVQKIQQAREVQAPCFFCEIVAGNVEISKIYEDDDFLIFPDIYPAVIGHSLLITKEHHIKEEKILELIRIIKTLKKAFYILGFNGINIVFNEGKSAGQQSDHFLLHLIPRKDNDEVQFGWKKEQVEKSSIEKISEAMRKTLEKVLEENKDKEIEPTKKINEKIDAILKFIKERKP